MDKPFAIFDMDGTLIDSMKFWKHLAIEYLNSKKIKDIPSDLLERIQPMTLSESAALFQQEFGLSGNPEAEMNAMMDSHYKNDIPLKSGVEKYLHQLKTKGVRMCVASSTAEDLMESCLCRLGVRHYFDFLLSCETIGSGKNSPRIYQESAKRLHATAEQITIYEDALYAIATAKEAGYYVAAVYDDSNADKWQTIKDLADAIILNWEETI